MSGTLESSESDARKDKPTYEICVCGHPEDSHEDVVRDSESGEILEERVVAPCHVAGWDCACGEFKPVARVSTLFPFRRPSRGSAEKHALVSGAQILFQSGGDMEWLTEDGIPTCDECGTSGNVMPFRSQLDLGKMGDKLLCQTCGEGAVDGEAQRRARTSITL